MNIYLSKLHFFTNDSKYTKWYFSIVKNCLTRTNQNDSKRQQRFVAKQKIGIVEAHHILPKCMCRTVAEKNDKYNLVYLTPREHFLLHWLLCKMVNDIKHKIQMVNSAVKLSSNRTVNSKNYERVKSLMSLIKRGQPTKPMSEVTKQRISDANKGRIPWNKNISYRKGIPKSIEMREKLSKSKLGNKSKSSFWKITNLESGHTEIIYNLKDYCKLFDIKYNDIYYGISRKNGVVLSANIQVEKLITTHIADS